MCCAASLRYSRGVVAADVLITMAGDACGAMAMGASTRGATWARGGSGCCGGGELQDASRVAAPTMAGVRKRDVGRYFIRVLARSTQVACKANLQRQG